MIKAKTHPISAGGTIRTVFLFAMFCGLASGCEDLDPTGNRPVLPIGIMLPYSGGYASEWDRALDWAAENINLAGGVAGYNIKLIKKDIGIEDVGKVAEGFLRDKSIRAVIGPLTSTDVFRIAPDFIREKKILIAPVATAGSLSGAFAGKKFFWRLVEPDISQTKTLLLLAQAGGARSVALITEESAYGETFEDWFGYFATELGLEVTGIRVIQPADTAAAGKAWSDMAAGQPDAVIAAVNLPELNTALVREYRRNGQQIRLLLSDAACFPSLASTLGPLAENLEGTNIYPDPKTGFEVAFNVRYGYFPDPILANLYDAVMLIALALEASGGGTGEALAEGLIRVVTGRNSICRWQRDDLHQAISLIRDGIYPDIQGASGSLDFDDLNYTDVNTTTYGHWRVDAGRFVVIRYYTSDGSGRISSTSAAYRTVAEKRQVFSDNGTWPAVQDRKGLYAFLMATSSGWANYRHQADVLHTYQLLRANGLDDEHIILILADDLAGSAANPLPGVVRNQPAGENLYRNVRIDYKLSEISPAIIERILTGRQTQQTPEVLTSTSGDDVFIYTCGHGTPDGMVLNGDSGGALTPRFWQSALDSMAAGSKFRRLFWAVESCYSGKIGQAVTTPGVLLMTAANAYETSKADQYDTELKSWIADRFSFFLNSTLAASPGIPFDQLYEKSYSYVNGSHVSFYNDQRFGNIYQLRLMEFIHP
jgi:ABC-type branched-subunit amino acid transport system substrate-binding protein